MDSLPTKAALGLLALVPFAALLTIAIHLAVVTDGRPELVVHLGPIDLSLPDLTIDELVPVAIAIGATVLAQVLVAILFVFHAQKNERLSSNARIAWILFLVFVGSIAEPIYWAIYVLPRGSPRA